MASLEKKAKDTYSLEAPNLHFERLHSGLPLSQPFLIENSINLELLLKLDQNIWRDTLFRTAWQLLWQPRPLLQPFDLGVSQNKNRSLWFVKQDQDIIFQKELLTKIRGHNFEKRYRGGSDNRDWQLFCEEWRCGHKDLTCWHHLWWLSDNYLITRITICQLW